MVVSEARLLDEVRAFQIREIRLLQDGKFREWFGLFTDDLRYWMPMVRVRETREEMVSGEGELAYFDDNFETLRLRVERLYSKLAWTEIPPSRTRYFVQLMAVTEEPSGELRVLSNYLISQARNERDQVVFFGERDDVLRRVDGELRIASRRVVIDNNVLGAKNLSIFF